MEMVMFSDLMDLINKHRDETLPGAPFRYS